MKNTQDIQGNGVLAVASSDGLEANVKRYNQYTYWHDDSMPRVETVIGDYDCNAITRYYRQLDDHEVKMFCDGHELGCRTGIEFGKTIKANEVKRALGL